MSIFRGEQEFEDEALMRASDHKIEDMTCHSDFEFSVITPISKKVKIL